MRILVAISTIVPGKRPLKSC